MDLDIGGGRGGREGIISMDINPDADIVHDLNEYPWPVKANSHNNAIMHHVLEHLERPLEAVRECYRLLRDGGNLKVTVPWWKRDMFTNPNHIHWFRPEWFKNLRSSSTVWDREMRIHDSMDWELVSMRKERGKFRFWRTYELHVRLKAIK